ncbi:SDR family NAD(P)-dependent oxidoreductase, partial [Gordonia terrae]
MANTVIVTGGTGGLGSAVVPTLLDAGWRVVVPWIEVAELDRLPSSTHLVAVEADLFDEGGGRSVIDAATSDRAAPLTSVVNLVGGFAMKGRIEDTSQDDYEALLRVNLWPLQIVTRAALPAIVSAGGGSIVGISARAALQPFSGASAYIAAKAAVWSFINSLAV